MQCVCEDLGNVNCYESKECYKQNSDSSNRLVIALRISREYEQENSKIKAREFGELNDVRIMYIYL